MPTDLGRPFSLEWRGNPPHLLKQDVPVWYRFLAKWGSDIINLYYDCLLGGPFLSPEDKKDSILVAWRAMNAKRADAIAELENEVWIIEVAPDPGVRIIGQLQTYRALWLRDPKINKIERMVLVSERHNTDLFDAASMLGILIYLV